MTVDINDNLNIIDINKIKMMQNPTFQSSISFQREELAPHPVRLSNTFSSKVFNRSDNQQSGPNNIPTRVHPSNQSHNIFGEHKSNKTQVVEANKHPKIRENPNTSGKHIFENPPPLKHKERLNDNV